MQEIVGGRYRLVERVGAGGMADVWRAIDGRTGETVALKRLHTSLLADPAALARFEREVAAARAVRHPRLVRLLDAHVAGDDAWIAMEFVEGGTLADRMRRGPIGEGAVATIGADVAEGLVALHAAGIVHRDVTPSNILLDGSQRARLGDLGIARPGDDDALAVTAIGDLVGTFRFMAPEQLSGGAATPASDAWALGAVLYEALAGRPPFDVSSPAALLASQRSPAPALAVHDAVLGALVARLLDGDPGARPSAAEATATLRAAAPLPDPSEDRTMVVAGGAGAERPAAARPPVAGAARPPVARAAGPAAVAQRDPRHASRRDPRAIAAATLLALLVVVGLVAAGGMPGGGGSGSTGAPVTTPGAVETPTPGASPTPAVTAAPAPAGNGGHGGNGKGSDKPAKPDKPGKGPGRGSGGG